MRRALTVGGPALMVRAIASSFFGFLESPVLHIAQSACRPRGGKTSFCGNQNPRDDLTYLVRTAMCP